MRVHKGGGIIAGFLMLLLIAGCSDDNKPPYGIISRPEMENILWDLIQAEQYSAAYIARDSSKVSLKDEDLKLYQEVCDLHHISRDDFKKSYNWYIKHPDLVANIFDSLQVKGQRLRNESYSQPAYGPLKQAAPPPPPSVRILPPGTLPKLSRPLLNKDSILKAHAGARKDSAAKEVKAPL